jgi:hypothetical protein
MYMFHHRNGGRNNLTTVNKFFENAANIWHCGTNLTIQNSVHEEIKSRFFFIFPSPL